MGFVYIQHIEQDIARVSIDPAKVEVTLIAADAAVTSQLSVQRGGVFLVTRKTA